MRGMVMALTFLVIVDVCVLPNGALAQPFDCAEATCPQMRSCAEAHYKLTVCGHGKRDADGDGIPCEQLCGKDMPTYLARVKAQLPANAYTGAADGRDVKPDADLRLIGSHIEADDQATATDQTFTCAGKRTCGQMVSCEEAKYYLSTCGAKSLDGDRDGVPCNSLCR